jgi:hypothetical protein
MKWLNATEEKSESKSKGMGDYRFSVEDFGFMKREILLSSV